MTSDLGLTSADEFSRNAALASGSLADALANQSAIVDSSGLIVAANEAWRCAGRHGGQLTLGTNGENYIEALDIAAGSGLQAARDAVDGLRSVLRRGSGQFYLEYEATAAPDGTRRFAFEVGSLSHTPAALITQRDVTERRKAEEALPGDLIAAGPLFETFIPALVKNLALALDMQHTFLAERLDEQRARILCHWTGQAFGEVYEYEIAGKPAELVLQGRSVAFPHGMESLYPDDPKEWRRAARSYIAAPVFDRVGEAIGFLGGIDFKPIADVPAAEAILRVFAVQVAPEMERRRAERDLADRAQLIDCAPDAIIGTDEHLVITHWNKTAETMYGWTADEVLGRTTRDVLKTAVSEDRLEAAQRVMREGREFRGVSIQRRKDGSAFDVELIGRPYRHSDGNVRGFILATRDISDRKHAEHALQQAEARARGILDAIPDMMFTFDAEGTYLTFTAARGMTPLLPPSEFIGKRVVDVMPPDVAARVMKSITACIRTAETQTFEYELTLQGEGRIYESRLALIAPGEVLSIIRDITANRRLDSDGYESVSRRAMPRRDSPRVLVIDHDAHALRFLRSTLEHAGHKAVISSDPDEASGLAEMEEPDLVLLDLTVAGKERIQSYLDLWRLAGVPTVVLGTREQEDDALRAVRQGAEDFIIKPLSSREVLIRIEAALRRSRSVPSPPSTPRRFGDLTVDHWNRRVTMDGQLIRLTATEFRLLVELAHADGRLLTHDEILERVWGPGYAGQHDLVRSYVRSLRRKLGDDARHPRYVLVEHGAGYRMAAATA
jgi:two-component system KDP operon response regulator KdpE